MKCDKLKSLFSKKTERQGVWYFLIGCSTTVLYLALLFFFTESFGIFYVFSALIAGFFSSGLNFLLNKTITFHEDIEKKLFEEFFRFAFIALCAWGIGFGLMIFLTEVLGFYYFLSSGLATLLSGSINFVFNKIYNFEG